MTKKTFGASLYGKGENPNGQLSQTADSTVKNQDGLGPQDYHWNQSADGPSWNDGFQPKSFAQPPATTQRRKR